MKNKRFNKKQFTLIELIIVIVAIGILAGMALPKFMGVQRDAKVSAMFRDVDTLEKTIMLYYQDNDELPIYDLSENTFNVSQTLLDTLNRKGDDVSKLKVVDKAKLKKYLSKNTKYGNDKNENDEYLYSELTGNVYYSQGLKNGQNVTYHTYENANGDPIYKDEDGKVLSEIKNVKFGNTLLKSNRTTLDENPTNDLVGLVSKGKTLKIEVNGVDLSSQIKKEDLSENLQASLFTTVKAADGEFETFTLPANLDKTKVNKVRIKIAEENKIAIFLVDFKGELEAPDVDVDTTKNPYELIVNYPSGVNVSETQYIVDNKETTTTKPNLSELMDGTTHTIDVRYKTTDNKLSEWANVSFSYSDSTEKPTTPESPEITLDSWIIEDSSVTRYVNLGLTESDEIITYGEGYVKIYDKEGNKTKSFYIEPLYEDNVKKINTGYIVTSRKSGATTPTIARYYDNNGTLVWQKEITFTPGVANHQKIYDIIQDSDGNLIFVGQNDAFPSGKDIIAKYDINGNKIWEFNNLYYSTSEEFTRVFESSDGNYIVVSRDNTNDVILNIYKFNKNGEKIKSQKFNKNIQMESMHYSNNRLSFVDSKEVTYLDNDLNILNTYQLETVADHNYGSYNEVLKNGDIISIGSYKYDDSTLAIVRFNETGKIINSSIVKKYIPSEQYINEKGFSVNYIQETKDGKYYIAGNIRTYFPSTSSYRGFLSILNEDFNHGVINPIKK